MTFPQQYDSDEWKIDVEQKMSYLSEKGLDLEQRKKFYFGLIEKYNLTIAVAEKFRNAFSISEKVRNDDVIFGDAWEKGLTKRPTTRDIYGRHRCYPRSMCRIIDT